MTLLNKTNLAEPLVCVLQHLYFKGNIMKLNFSSVQNCLTLSLVFCTSLAPLANATPLPTTLDYADTFDLEYVASPIFSKDSETIIYERRSNDIMRDATHISLWQYDIDKKQHRPFIAESENVYNPHLSNDGKKLAYLSDRSGSLQLYVRYLETNQDALLSHLQSAPSHITWSPDDKYIAFSLFTEKPSQGLFTQMPNKPDGANWAPTATYIEKTTYRADGAGYLPSGNEQIYILPIDGGTPRQLTAGDYDSGGPLAWSHDGQFLYFSANPADNADLAPLTSDIYSVAIANADITQITSLEGPESSPQLSPDGRYLSFRHTVDKKMSYQQSELMLLDLKTDKIISLTATLDRSVNTAQWAADSDSLYFSYDNKGMTQLAEVELDGDIHTFDIHLGGQSLGRPYTSGEFAVAANGAIAFTLDSSQHPAELAYMTRRGKVSQLTQLNDDVLGHLTLADTQTLAVTSSIDNRSIDAWIMMPPHYDADKSYPLILEIHGGPHAAYGPHFAMELQLMAAKGYVVVWSNPRGSSSYGAEFGNTIHHNYPSHDYDDLMDVVDAAIAKVNIDTQNLFVTGGSGGGVLTAWTVGKTHRFAAAVVAKPVINWVSHSLTADAAAYFTQYWMSDMPWNIADKLWRRSPLSLVGNVTTPTMLLTGESDYRTPISESEQYYQALRLQGVDAAMVRLPGSSHGIASKPSRLIQKVGNILAWFERYKTAQKPRT
jgi:dipeptidyl aminopeptidase/acylaminoacyl peptidase